MRSFTHAARATTTSGRAPMAPPSPACPQVRNILRGARVQPKLRVGAPDDPAEREADQIADRVMRMPEPSVHPRPAPAGIQRMCAEC